MEKFPTWMLVVAGAMRRADGRWLMHRRPLDKQHGGLWEFPGGKVEPAETPAEALVRELREELGIEVDRQGLVPAGFAQGDGESGAAPIVILLYRIDSWQGEPVALEGEGIGWFTADQIGVLDKPPLDIALARALIAKEAG